MVGDSSVELHGFAAADSARQGDLTFAENETYFHRADHSAASAILVTGLHASTSGKTLICVTNARNAFAQVLPLFFPEPVFPPGRHSSAVVADSAIVDPSAHIGPGCVVGERVRIGAGVVLQAQDFVGDDSVLGDHVRLFPHVTLYPRSLLGRRVRVHSGTVIGADGFGYVFDQGQHRKVPQVGQVILHDDVEIGANVTIDRAALGATVIGTGTKIGNYTTIAGQVGIAGHLRIGDQVTIAAQSGVMNHIPEGQKWMGTPAQPDRVMKRQWLAAERLPELLRRVGELERQLAERGTGSTAS